jgi:hypothetical protein
MRSMIVTTLSLGALLVGGIATDVQAGASVQISIGTQRDWPEFEYFEADVDDENLIVISDNEVGYWVMLPSGRWVMRTRRLWFDNGCSEWRFGPWSFNYSVNYGCQCNGPFHGYCPFHGERYRSYVVTHYPHRNYYREGRGCDRPAYYDRPDCRNTRSVCVLPPPPLPLPPPFGINPLRRAPEHHQTSVTRTTRIETMPSRQVTRSAPARQSAPTVYRTTTTRTTRPDNQDSRVVSRGGSHRR